MDKKAAAILIDYYWSTQGWKKERVISDSDKDYATRNGCWYEPRVTNHSRDIKQLVELVRETDPTRLARNFVSSLNSRDVHLRSALGSFAVHRHLNQHDQESGIQCQRCGMYNTGDSSDLNVLNFERIKWGGIRHDQPTYALFDLQTSISERHDPTAEDVQTFRNMIEAILALPELARVRDAEKVLGKVVKSNKAEREVILHILGYCGILQPKARLTFFKEHIRFRDRAEPPSSKNDWGYPVSWWRGNDSVNVEALRYYFGWCIEKDFA